MPKSLWKNTVTDSPSCAFISSHEQCDDQIVTYLSDDDINSLIILLIRALVFTVRKPLQQRVSVQFCSASVVQVGDCSFLFDSKVFTAGNHEAVK